MNTQDLRRFWNLIPHRDSVGRIVSTMTDEQGLSKAINLENYASKNKKEPG
jgi:hypothetical protein